MNLTSIQFRMLRFLSNEEEIKTRTLKRKFSNKVSELDAAISALKKAGFIAFTTIPNEKVGPDPELLKITDAGLLAFKKHEPIKEWIVI